MFTRERTALVGERDEALKKLARESSRVEQLDSMGHLLESMRLNLKQVAPRGRSVVEAQAELRDAIVRRSQKPGCREGRVEGGALGQDWEA